MKTAQDLKLFFSLRFIAGLVRKIDSMIAKLVAAKASITAKQSENTKVVEEKLADNARLERERDAATRLEEKLRELVG